MMGTTYFDGKSARVHDINLNYGEHGLSFYCENEFVQWNYSKIKLLDINLLKVTHQDFPDARMNLGKSDFETLCKFAPQISHDSHKRNRNRLVLGLSAAGIAFSALIFFGIPMASRPLALITPPEVEQQFLGSIEAQIDVAFNFCEIDNEGGRALQRLAQKISKNGNLKFNVDIGVIDMNMPNAFALPGGKIYFTQALLQEAENGDEIAGVMSHEIAHIENRDVMASLYRIMGFAVLLDAIVGGGSGASQQLIMLGANLTDLKNSRDAEQRADMRGIELLEKAGLGTQGLISFFKKIEKLEKSTGIGDWAEFMSSHPATSARSEKISRLAKNGEPALSANELTEVKKICSSNKSNAKTAE